MLDCMSGGRIISGFVRGVPQEYLALGKPLADARSGSPRPGISSIKASGPPTSPSTGTADSFGSDHMSISPRPLHGPSGHRACPPTATRASRSRGPSPGAYQHPLSSPLTRRKSNRHVSRQPPARHARRGRPSTASSCATSRRLDERAGAEGGRAASRLLLAEAPELPPRLDEAPRSVAAGAAVHRPVRGGAPGVRVRLRSDAEEGLTFVSDPSSVTQQSRRGAGAQRT